VTGGRALDEGLLCRTLPDPSFVPRLNFSPRDETKTQRSDPVLVIMKSRSVNVDASASPIPSFCALLKALGRAMSSRLIALGLVASPLAESTRPQQPINADGTQRDEPSPDEQEPREGLSAEPEPAAFRPGPQLVPGIEVKVTVACHGHAHGHQEVTVSVRVDAFSEDDAQVSMAPSDLPHVCAIAEVIALAGVKEPASAKFRCNGREVLPAAALASLLPSEMLRKWRSGDVAGAIPLTLHVYHAAAANTASAVRLALEINPAIGTQEAASIVRAALSSPPRAIGFRRSGPFASRRDRTGLHDIAGRSRSGRGTPTVGSAP
jgi:hypothetical protein